MYSFEFLPNFSKNYNDALTEYNKAEEINKAALDVVKKESANTPSGKKYQKTFSLSLEKWNIFSKAEENEKVFTFKSMQLFLGEFGVYFCFFIYTLFNLVRSFVLKQSKGYIILHTTLLSGTIFYLFWVFQQFQDFPKVTYYLMTIFSACFMAFGVYIIMRLRKDKIDKITQQRNNIVSAVMFYIQEDKQEEVLKNIKENLK